MSDTPKLAHKTPLTTACIRWMIRRDMPEILEIENASFDHPWDEEKFLKYLRLRNCIGMVIEHSDKVLGFMVYEIYKTYLRIYRLAVHPSFRREGLGLKLVERLKEKLSSQRRDRLVVTVRESNLAGQMFLRAQKLRCTGTERGVFQDADEDGFTMVYSLLADDTREEF